MRALLDTHAFLWWNMDHHALSPKARAVIADASNEIFFSAASAWEIAIKASRGRLSLPDPPDAYISDRLTRHGFVVMPVLVSHATHVFELPDHHRDPFDRLLVAQAKVENLSVLSGDRALASYGIDLVW